MTCCFCKYAQNPLFTRLYTRSKRQTDSVCLEDTKKMPLEPDGVLADSHFSSYSRVICSQSYRSNMASISEINIPSELLCP